MDTHTLFPFHALNQFFVYQMSITTSLLYFFRQFFLVPETNNFAWNSVPGFWRVGKFRDDWNCFKLGKVKNLISFCCWPHTHNRSGEPSNRTHTNRWIHGFACMRAKQKEEKKTFFPNFLSLSGLFAAFPHASITSCYFQLINNSLVRLSTRFRRRNNM